MKPRPVTVAIIAVLLFGLGWLGVGFARGGGEEEKRPPAASATSGAPSSPSSAESPAASSDEPKIIRRPEISPAPGPPQPGEPIESPVPKSPEPEAILLVSGHSFGWITPCGCEGVRAGGVARRAGYGDLLRKTYPGVSVHYLDLGGVLSLETDAQRITTDALIDAMVHMKYEAMNVSLRDLGKSFADSEYARTHLTMPRISANIVFHDTGKLAFPPYRILRIPRPGQPQADPIRIGLLGLVNDRESLFAFGDDGRSVVVRPIVQAVERYLPELRAQSDLVIVMAETSPDPFYSILKKFKGIDLVMCGQASELLIEPILVGKVPICAVGLQGKYIQELRVVRTGEKLEIVPFLHWLDARFPQDPALRDSTEAVLDRINESSRRDIAQDTTPPPPIAPFMGTEACESCHEREVEIWRRSKHSHAFETLVALKRDYTMICVGCHVTGFLHADGGGFLNPRATPQLTGVQCESCHGPAQAHIADPSAPYPKRPDDIAVMDVCINCHTREQDPKFDRDVRWPVVAH